MIPPEKIRNIAIIAHGELTSYSYISTFSGADTIICEGVRDFRCCRRNMFFPLPCSFHFLTTLTALYVLYLLNNMQFQLSSKVYIDPDEPDVQGATVKSVWHRSVYERVPRSSHLGPTT